MGFVRIFLASTSECKGLSFKMTVRCPYFRSGRTIFPPHTWFPCLRSWVFIWEFEFQLTRNRVHGPTVLRSYPFLSAKVATTTLCPVGVRFLTLTGDEMSTVFSHVSCSFWIYTLDLESIPLCPFWRCYNLNRHWRTSTVVSGSAVVFFVCRPDAPLFL